MLRRKAQSNGTGLQRHTCSERVTINMYKYVNDSSEGKPCSFNHGILFTVHTYTSKMADILGRKESRFLYTKVNSPSILSYTQRKLNGKLLKEHQIA